MKRVRLTISVDPEIAEYLRSAPNASLLVCEAVKEYRSRTLERELEDAYREDASEAARLNVGWESTDTAVPK